MSKDYCHPCRGTGIGTSGPESTCRTCGGQGYKPEPPDERPRRRGRPPMGDAARRNGDRIQFSPMEWAAIDAARGGASRQDFIMGLIAPLAK